jgi:hypothetical protein
VITSTKEMGKVSEDSGIAIRKVLDEFMRISDGMVEVNASMEEIRERSDAGMGAIGNVAEGMDEVASTSEEMAVLKNQRFLGYANLRFATTSSEETSAAIEEQTAAIQQLSDTMNSVRKHASETYAEMIENFKVEEG